MWGLVTLAGLAVELAAIVLLGRTVTRRYEEVDPDPPQLTAARITGASPRDPVPPQAARPSGGGARHDPVRHSSGLVRHPPTVLGLIPEPRRSE